MRGGHVSPDEWLVDSGATHHMTKAKDDLAERSDRTISHVRLGDGNVSNVWTKAPYVSRIVR